MPATKQKPAPPAVSPVAELPSWPAQFKDAAGTWGPGLAGVALLLLALPPWKIWPLAWLAPLSWLSLINRPRLAGRKPYRTLWLVGTVFWLLAVHWLRLPHWTTTFGWVALALYLGIYLPAFIGLSRGAVHQLGVPLVLAAPVVWTGLELARAHLLTGFLMGALGHTQITWLTLIQFSDLGGAYGVSFLMMLVAAGFFSAKKPTGGVRIGPVLIALAALASALVYGHWRLAQEVTRPGPRVALIQGVAQPEWKQDAGFNDRIVADYFRLSQQAVLQAEGRLDLVVWPETMYRRPLFEFTPDYVAPSDEIARTQQEWAEFAPNELGKIARDLDTPLLFGLDVAVVDSQTERHYNAAVFVDRPGRIVGRYEKIHRVMFGEYIPLAEYFPWLYRLTPLTGGLHAGKSPQGAEIERVRYAPNICYESAMPHVIARQVRELAGRHQEPDVLVNLTNDAWFRGSSELDMHLACGVFRAIEFRKPLLVAANGGISAHIDSSGRIVKQSPRQKEEALIAAVNLDGRHTPYRLVGDLPAGLCLLAALVWGGLAWRRLHRAKTA